MEADWLLRITRDAYVRMAEQADYRALLPAVRPEPDNSRPWPPAPLTPEERRQVDTEASDYAVDFDRIIASKRLVIEGRPPVHNREAFIYLIEAVRAMCAPGIDGMHPYSFMQEKRLVELALEAMEAEERADWEHAKSVLADRERERSRRVQLDEE